MTQTTGQGRRALVVGLGVSGMATALRLQKSGWETVIVERSPGRRTGGYFIAVFGSGRSAAQRLGILDGMHDRSSSGRHLDLDRHGNARDGMSYDALPGEPWHVVRGDIERAAFARLPADTDIRFGTTPVSIVQVLAAVFWVTSRVSRLTSALR